MPVAVVQKCSVKKLFLEILQNSQENTCARASFLIKLKKETLVQVFSCEFCEISKNTFFHRTPLVAASVEKTFIDFSNKTFPIETSIINLFHYIWGI